MFLRLLALTALVLCVTAKETLSGLYTVQLSNSFESVLLQELADSDSSTSLGPWLSTGVRVVHFDNTSTSYWNAFEVQPFTLALPSLSDLSVALVTFRAVLFDWSRLSSHQIEELVLDVLLPAGKAEVSVLSSDLCEIVLHNPQEQLPLLTSVDILVLVELLPTSFLSFSSATSTINTTKWGIEDPSLCSLDSFEELYSPVTVDWSSPSLSDHNVVTLSPPTVTSTSTYGSMNYLMDSFVYSHSDTLLIVPSGDHGTRLKGAALSKNVLVVAPIAEPSHLPNDRFPNSNVRILPKTTSHGPIHGQSLGLTLLASPYSSVLVETCTLSHAAALGVSKIAVSIHDDLVSSQNITRPSSSLLRSLLIAYSSSVEGTAVSQRSSSRFSAVGAAPNVIQGFGEVLYNPETPYIVLNNEDHVLSHQGVVSHCVEVEEGELNVVLSYNDIPSLSCDNSCLLNRLGLIVVTSDETVTSNTLTLTNKKISFRSKNSGIVRIIVYGESIVSPQTFSLVVSGGVVGQSECPNDSLCSHNCVDAETGLCTNSLSDTCQPCPRSCFGRGACHSGVCVCDFPFFGPDCGSYHAPLSRVIDVAPGVQSSIKLVEGISSYTPGSSASYLFKNNPAGMSLFVRDLDLSCGSAVTVSEVTEEGNLVLQEMDSFSECNDCVFRSKNDLLLEFESSLDSSASQNHKGFTAVAIGRQEAIPVEYCSFWTELSEEREGSMSIHSNQNSCTYSFGNIHEHDVLEYNISNMVLAEGDSIQVDWYWNNRVFTLNHWTHSRPDMTFYIRHPITIRLNSNSKNSSFDLSFAFYTRPNCPDHVPTYWCRAPVVSQSEAYVVDKDLRTVSFSLDEDTQATYPYPCELITSMENAVSCLVKNDEVFIKFKDRVIPFISNWYIPLQQSDNSDSFIFVHSKLRVSFWSIVTVLGWELIILSSFVVLLAAVIVFLVSRSRRERRRKYHLQQHPTVPNTQVSDTEKRRSVRLIGTGDDGQLFATSV
ncbi:hypothetical protein RCL1_005184 [Eukaryota sp. TZLM3-RCL]